MTLTIRVEKIIKKINNKISYSYIDNHTNSNKINISKLKTLIFLMDNSSLSKKEQEDYIVATMLVEIALDTHEQVKENEEINNDYTKALTKQLSVLGGDYYSSLYYLLLAKIEHFSFIKHLATAIKNVNELKMDFYFHSTKDVKEYITMRKAIEKHIVMSVAKYVEVDDQDLLNALELIFIIDLLIREKQGYEKDQTFMYFKQDHIRNNLIYNIENFVDDYKGQLSSLFKQTKSEILLQFEQFYNVSNNDQLVHMEEG